MKYVDLAAYQSLTRPVQLLQKLSGNQARKSHDTDQSLNLGQQAELHQWPLLSEKKEIRTLDLHLVGRD